MAVDLVEAVDAFCALPLDALDDGALQQRALLARSLAGRLLGCADQALAQLDVLTQGHVVTSITSDGTPLLQPTHGWWRDTALLTGNQAGQDLRRSNALRDLSLIGRAVVDGVLTPEQGAILTRLHGKIPQEDLLDAQQQLIDVARTMDKDGLSRFVSRLIATHCEHALDAEQGAAHARRYLQLKRRPDGTVRGTFVLAAEDAEVVLTVLEPLARRQGEEDEREVGQRRADALVEVFAAAASWMDLPQAGGQRPQLAYVVTGEWCAGEQPLALPEHLASTGLHASSLARFVAEGAWTGPQTRARIESALCDARISRVLLDGCGAVVSLESLNDQITSAQRRAVSIRDRHCVARGCTRPPAFCDVHHLEHRADGGVTAVHNLALLCRRHHLLWHRGLLTLQELRLPWLQHDRWDGHSPPLTA